MDLHSLVDQSVRTVLLPGFESKAQHLRYYFKCEVNRTKIKQKEAGFGTLKNIRRLNSSCRIEASATKATSTVPKVAVQNSQFIKYKLPNVVEWL